MNDPDDILLDEESFLQNHVLEDQGSISDVPTIRYYQKRYAYSLSNNDQKAARMFKEYEALEMLRRLQAELLWVRNNQVLHTTLDSVLGKTRRSRYRGYDAWAKLMLLWISQAKK